jgi:hypothetical protein
MCIVCKLKKKKTKRKIEYVSTDMTNNWNDFLYVKGKLEKHLGITLSKTDVVKHAFVIALKHYNSGCGVDSLNGGQYD